MCNRSVEALQLGREPIAVLGLMLVPVNKSLAGAPYHGMLRACDRRDSGGTLTALGRIASKRHGNATAWGQHGDGMLPACARRGGGVKASSWQLV